MMKWKNSILLFSFFLFPRLFSSSLQVPVKAEYALLMNAETGKILMEKNGHARVFPASTTKIATLLYALECLKDNLDAEITADQDCIGSISVEEKRRSNYSLPAYWLEPGASHMGIKKGEILPLKTLLYGHMIASADDASNMIAKYVGGSIPKFMEEMNEYLTKLGCQDTHFVNPHGLFHPNHYTTPYDLALMMKAALKNETFCTIMSAKKYPRPKTNKQEASTLAQTNLLLRPGKHYYSKAIGGKTGYIEAAQKNLVAAAKDPKTGRILIACVMRCKERSDTFQDAINLFEAAFKQQKVHQIILRKGPVKYELAIEGTSKKIKTHISEDIIIDYYPAEEPEVRCLLYPKKVTLPIKENEVLGTLEVVDGDGKLLKEISLLALKNHDFSWSEKMKTLASSHPWMMIFTLILFVIFWYLGFPQEQKTKI